MQFSNSKSSSSPSRFILSFSVIFGVFCVVFLVSASSSLFSQTEEEESTPPVELLWHDVAPPHSDSDIDSILGSSTGGGDDSGLPDVSYLDGVLGGEKGREAVKKLEEDRILVDAAKIQMAKKSGGKSTAAAAAKKNKLAVAASKKKAVVHILHHPPEKKQQKILKILGVQKAKLTRLSKRIREEYSNGELREREREISEHLHEHNQRVARRLEREALRAQLKKVRKETSKDLRQIRNDKDGGFRNEDHDVSWLDDSFHDDSTGKPKFSAHAYKQEENHIRRQLRREDTLHPDDNEDDFANDNSDDEARNGFKAKSLKILKALKQDTKQVNSAVKAATSG